MGLRVMLIDKSEIALKMLSHCLHYFAAEIVRFDSLKESRGYFSEKKPDIVFVDWELQEAGRPLVYSLIEDFKAAPLVLLRRAHDKKQLEDDLKLKGLHQLEKPLDLKAVRDKVKELCPKIKESPIHSFLHFPEDIKKPQEQKSLKEESGRPAEPFKSGNQASQGAALSGEGLRAKKEQEAFIRTQISKILSSKEEETMESIPVPNSFSGGKEDSKSSLKERLGGGLTDETRTHIQILSSKDSGAAGASSPSGGAAKKAEGFGVRKKEVSAKISMPDSEADELGKSRSSSPAEKNQSEKIVKSKMDKENINIDEDTQNDLAPMAIKRPPAAKLPTDKPIELSEKDILRVLNKYKDTLEFQKLIENFLGDHAKKTIQNLLEREQKSGAILKDSLQSYTEGKPFKELVLREISQYVQKRLPFVIKEVVEREIKKITEV